MPPLFLKRGGELLLKQHGIVQLSGLGFQPFFRVGELSRNRLAFFAGGVAFTRDGFGLLASCFQISADLLVLLPQLGFLLFECSLALFRFGAGLLQQPPGFGKFGGNGFALA